MNSIEDATSTIAAIGGVSSGSATFGVASAPSQGTAAVTDPANGGFTYTPDPDTNGTDSFEFEVCTADRRCASATIAIRIEPQNDAPVAIDDAPIQAREDIPLVFGHTNLLDNDSDVEDGPVMLDAFTQPANGSLVQAAPGSLSYEPDPQWFGTDTFTYRVVDSDGLVSETWAQATIEVASVNDPPVALADGVTVNEDQRVVIPWADLLDNDLDPDLSTGDMLTIADAVAGANTQGVVVLSTAARTLEFTPVTDFNGSTIFAYEACDLAGACSLATVEVDVLPVADAPVAIADTITFEVNEDELVIPLALLGNDTDIDGGPLELTSIDTATTTGTAVLGPDGITYTPAPGATSDEFTYEITDDTGLRATALVSLVLVNEINDRPIASGDSLTAEASITSVGLAGDLLGNDTDVDIPWGDSLRMVSAQPNATTTGHVTLTADGMLEYTPTQGATSDSFTYTVEDTNGASDVATVDVTIVNTVNDDPVAAPDAIRVEATETTIVNPSFLLVNDTDLDVPYGDSLQILSVAPTGATGGSIVMDAAGIIRYTPLPTSRADVFAYTVTDDAGAVATGLVNVTITNLVNDPPEPQDDIGEPWLATDNETPLKIAVSDLLANDDDKDLFYGDQLTVTNTFSQAGQGSTTTFDGNDFTFTPGAESEGDLTFMYEVCDVAGECANAAATVAVTNVENAPVIAGNKLLVLASWDRAENFQLVATDSDPGDTITWSGASGLPIGLTLNPDGTITGTVPTGGQLGTFVTTAIATDSTGLSTSANITVELTTWEQSPLASKLVISEVLYKSTVSSLDPADAGVFDEFVELQNVGQTPIDLAGMTLRDWNSKLDTPDIFEWSLLGGVATGPTSIDIDLGARAVASDPNQGTVLAPGEIATIWMTPPTMNATVLNVNSPLDNTMVTVNFTAHGGTAAGAIEMWRTGDWWMLDDAGDDLWLIDDEGLIIDYVAWERLVDNDRSNISPHSAPFLSGWNAAARKAIGDSLDGQSAALARLPGTGPSCWEITTSGAATCPGASLTQDRDLPDRGIRRSSAGAPNID